MKTYIPLGIEQGFALPRHGTCTASRFSMAGILLLLLHFSHVHYTFFCLCLCACMLPNWKLQDQWKKICITLLTFGTRTFSSTASHFSETLAQIKTTSWKQPHRGGLLATPSLQMIPLILALPFSFSLPSFPICWWGKLNPSHEESAWKSEQLQRCKPRAQYFREECFSVQFCGTHFWKVVIKEAVFWFCMRDLIFVKHHINSHCTDDTPLCFLTAE